MALTDCNLAHRDGRTGHAGNQHRHKGERRRLRSTKKKKSSRWHQCENADLWPWRGHCVVQVCGPVHTISLTMTITAQHDDITSKKRWAGGVVQGGVIDCPPPKKKTTAAFLLMPQHPSSFEKSREIVPSPPSLSEEWEESGGEIVMLQAGATKWEDELRAQKSVRWSRFCRRLKTLRVRPQVSARIFTSEPEPDKNFSFILNVVWVWGRCWRETFVFLKMFKFWFI